MLVAFEGIDGSGKGTQAALLAHRARNQGLQVAEFSFPQYGANAFASGISDYLNGKYGRQDAVSPYLAALLYAGDRFCSRGSLLAALGRVDLVICDRYVPSNVAHQAAKIPDPADRDSFIKWIEDIEYRIYEMPKADVTILLSAPVAVATQLIARKAGRTYTHLRADIHESDAYYLSHCGDVYRFLAERDALCWHVEEIAPHGQLRTTDDIADAIWGRVSGGLRSPESNEDLAGEIRRLFDDVMRNPESARGLDVETTARLLAEAAKSKWPIDYLARLRELEEHYLDQFLHTAMAIPGFSVQVRTALGRHR